MLALLAQARQGPQRTGSVISTVYGDAVLPRGGSLAAADLLALMRGLGLADGVVRTALSRLTKEGVLLARRAGRHSAYALTEAATTEFLGAVPRIYGGSPAWDGVLRLAFPEPGSDRAALDAAGFAPVAPGVLVSPRPFADAVEAAGPAEALQALAARAWPLGAVRADYAEFVAAVAGLDLGAPPSPAEAIAARILLIHAFRRIALRDPHLPAALLPADWPGHAARALCARQYAALAPGSEAWLDAAGLPPGADPAVRFGA